jgi:hypothetical protein
MKTFLSPTYQRDKWIVTVKPKITPPILKDTFILIPASLLMTWHNTMPTEEKSKRISKLRTVDQY